MLKGIHHAAIICSDYAVSKHFYTDILGLKIIAENYRTARDSYKLDLALPNGGQLELFSFPITPERPSRPEACGLRHLAFAVDCLYFLPTRMVCRWSCIRLDLHVVNG
jgi:glyoxylase I family protein